MNDCPFINNFSNKMKSDMNILSSSMMDLVLRQTNITLAIKKNMENTIQKPVTKMSIMDLKAYYQTNFKHFIVFSNNKMLILGFIVNENLIEKKILYKTQLGVRSCICLWTLKLITVKDHVFVQIAVSQYLIKSQLGVRSSFLFDLVLI